MVATQLQNGVHAPLDASGAPHWHFVPHRVDPRERRQVKFWVDVRTDLGQWMHESMKGLKEQRLFKETMLQGARLIVDLRNKKMDYLYEVAPWLEPWIEARIEAEVARRVALAADTSALEARLAKLEALLAGQGAPTPTPGPRPLTPAPADDADADLLVVQKAESDGASANKNFLNSAFSLANK